MTYVVTLKVWKEDENGEIIKKWYNVKNAEQVLKLELCSGDKLLIDGIGNLEICGLDYKSRLQGEHPFESLIIICGLITNAF